MEAGVLHEGRATFSLDLHPAYSENALEGVKLQLEARLLRWDEAVSGVLLAYRNLQKIPSEATIRPYFPYIQIQVEADVIVFRPRVGAVLCGRVTKLGSDFIGMTVLGSINAAIGRQNIRMDLQFQPLSQVWESAADPSNKIELGCDLLFCVDSLRIDGNGVLAVLGSLKEPWSGPARLAAARRPNAFPQAARWQRMMPQIASLQEITSTAGFQGLDDTEALAPREDLEAPVTATTSEAVETLLHPDPSDVPAEEPKKKKKRKVDSESTDAPAQQDEIQDASLAGRSKKRRKVPPASTYSQVRVKDEPDAELDALPNGSPGEVKASFEKPDQPAQPVAEKEKKKKRRKAEAAAVKAEPSYPAPEKIPNSIKIEADHRPTGIKIEADHKPVGLTAPSRSGKAAPGIKTERKPERKREKLTGTERRSV